MSNYQTIYVSKETAKRMIDASPSQKICVTIIDIKNQCSSNTELMKKVEGHTLIDAAKKIGYENHCIFGRLDLIGVLKDKEKRELMHCITFPNEKPVDEKCLS